MKFGAEIFFLRNPDIQDDFWIFVQKFKKTFGQVGAHLVKNSNFDSKCLVLHGKSNNPPEYEDFEKNNLDPQLYQIFKAIKKFYRILSI